MNRILTILAFVVALAVAGAAIYELNQRAEDDTVALPTTPPSQASPTELPSPVDTPTDAPAGTGEATQEPQGSIAAATTAPAPSETAEPDETEAPDPTPTAAPPRTPTPEPAATIAPIDTSGGSTPHTGADSWPAGLALTVVALGFRGLLLRRRSY